MKSRNQEKIKTIPNLIVVKSVDPNSCPMKKRVKSEKDDENASSKYGPMFTLKPLHTVLSVFGLARLPDRNETRKKIHSLTMIAVLIAILIWTVKKRLDTVYKRMSNVLMITDLVALLTMSAMSVGTWLVVGFQSPNIQINIINDYNMIDSLSNIDLKIKYGNGRRVVMKLILSVLSMILVISSVQHYCYVKAFDFDYAVSFLLNYVLYVMNSLVLVQFALAMYSMRVHFIIFNIQIKMFTYRCLNNGVDVDNDDLYFTPTFFEELLLNARKMVVLAKSGIRGHKLDINQTAKAYILTCDQCDRYNNFFSAQNFLLTFNGIISILKSLHMISVYVVNKDILVNDNSVYMMIGPIGFALFDIFILYIITSSCESVVKDAENTSCAIDILMYNKVYDNVHDAMICSQMIARRLPKFSALGFFDMNLSLLSSIAGTIATYLIMLVQIRTPE